ncbi:hypothetical protein BKI52_33170 [marine bacterium AO1-C]|nr:hypothetical protein BKI52_33170 [marine bacterium AO1-C]
MIKDANIFITGPNGGIGLEVVKILSKRKAKSIALACRTAEKAVWTQQEVLKHHDTDTLLAPYGGFDMNDATAIEQAVAKLPQKPFDIIFLQAGGMVVANDFQFVQANGLQVEKTVYQNVIGAYITLLHLEKRALVAPNVRIVFPGGEGARGIKGMIKKPEFQSVEAFKTYLLQGLGKYKDIDALGISKFMSGLLVQQLAEMDKSKEYVWFSPGLTSGTNGLRDVAQPKRFVMEKIGFPMMNLLGIAQSPQKAAHKFVESLDGTYGKSGDLLGAPEGKGLGKIVDQKPMNAGLTNLQFRQAFWEIVKECVGGLVVSEV